MTSARNVAHSLRRELLGNDFTNSPFQWAKIGAVHTSPNTVDAYLDGSTTLTLGIRYASIPNDTMAVNDVRIVFRMGSDRVVGFKLA